MMHWHSPDVALNSSTEAPLTVGVSLSALEPKVMLESFDRKLKRRCVWSTGSRSTIFVPVIGLSAAQAGGMEPARHTTDASVRSARCLFTNPPWLPGQKVRQIGGQR